MDKKVRPVMQIMLNLFFFNFVKTKTGNVDIVIIIIRGSV